MTKTTVVTGSTDSIGLAIAKRLVAQGHTILLYGRNAAKREATDREVTTAAQGQTNRFSLKWPHSLTKLKNIMIASVS